MTAHTPAPKASGVPPPLAFLSSLSLPLPPIIPLSSPQEFSEVIAEALTSKTPSPSPAHSAPAISAKTAGVHEKAPDPSNLLLALLARSFSSAQMPAESQKTAGTESRAAAKAAEPAQAAPERKEAFSPNTLASTKKPGGPIQERAEVEPEPIAMNAKLERFLRIIDTTPADDDADGSINPSGTPANKAASKPNPATKGAATPPPAATLADGDDLLSGAGVMGMAVENRFDGSLASNLLAGATGKAAAKVKSTIHWAAASPTHEAASGAGDDLSSAKATRIGVETGFDEKGGANFWAASTDKEAPSAAAKPEPVRNGATTSPGDGSGVTASAEEGDPLNSARATVIAVKSAGDAGAAVIGTPVANTSQRMNLSAERNEFAGATEQKMPPGTITAAAVTAVEAPSAVRPRTAKHRLQFDWHDTPTQVLTIMDPAGKAVENARRIEAGPDQTVNGQLNRIETSITREAFNFRQKGAESIGVSLKVDERTELFLQLTNKDGQLQASLRCERGDFSALDSQWTQLQQSLARQNVQLMPLGGMNSSLPQSSDRQQGQPPPAPKEGTVVSPIVEPKQTRNSKLPIRSRQRWESWA